MAKKLFKKKSFWAKLPTKAKVGVIALVIALVGAGAAYALSQSDASLQSKASLSCEESCKAACNSITDGTQAKNCLGACVSKCQATQSKVPSVCTRLDYMVNNIKKNGELSRREVAVARRTLKEAGEDIQTGWNPPSTQSFQAWYNKRCVVKQACEPNWTRVVDMVRPRPLPMEGDQKPGATSQQPTTARYFWPDGCKGNPPTNGEKRGCTSALVALTQAEVAKYQAWLKAGKPTTNLCGGTSGTNCTPIPRTCTSGDIRACKLSPYVNWCPTPDPAPATTCPTPPTCKPPQTVVEGRMSGGSQTCPIYRCI